jgi:alpha-ketoglutaric semialdehyde dehydrogenase
MGKPTFPDATFECIDQTLKSAHSCFIEFSKKKAGQRANFLRRIADNLQKHRNSVIETAEKETSLGLVRLKREFSRTIDQIRLFGTLAQKDEWKDMSTEVAEPHRTPIAKPEMYKVNHPIGPVVVIGACNFPLAISVVGTDTTSALAVGCPVVVKSHPRHAKTCQLLADLVNEAKRESNMPEGCFHLVHGESHVVSTALVSHPKTACVAFTGSLQGGQALYKVANSRPSPIPFHAEMGSLNPVFALPFALKEKEDKIVSAYIDAVNLFAGQMCTKPGALIILEESFDEIFEQSLLDSVLKNESLPMLNSDVFQNYEKTSLDLAQSLEIIAQSEVQSSTPKGKIRIFKTMAKDFLTRPELKAEAFGPASILVIARDFTEMLTVAESMEGSLTGSMLVSENDKKEASALFPILESKVGRILWNGFPPGVIPGIATHHGGPWPATTDSRYTSIGIQGYKRFVRPICKQGFYDLRGMS